MFRIKIYVNLATNIASEILHKLIAVLTCFLFHTIPFSSLYGITERFSFHFAFPVIPVGKITALCYTDLRPDIKKSTVAGSPSCLLPSLSLLPATLSLPPACYPLSPSYLLPSLSLLPATLSLPPACYPLSPSCLLPSLSLLPATLSLPPTCYPLSLLAATLSLPPACYPLSPSCLLPSLSLLPATLSPS